MTANSISLLSKAMLHNLGKLFILSVRTMDDFLLPEKNIHKVPLLLLSKLKKCTYVKTFGFVDGQVQKGKRVLYPQYGRMKDFPFHIMEDFLFCEQVQKFS